MEIKGILKKVCPVEEIQGSKGTFTKRTIVIDCSNIDDVTGEIRENIIALETSGRFCSDYDAYVDHVGEKVTARFGISGRSYSSNDGKEKYINTLRIISLSLDEPRKVIPNPSPSQQVQQRDFNQPQEGDDLPF